MWTMLIIAISRYLLEITQVIQMLKIVKTCCTIHDPLVKQKLPPHREWEETAANPNISQIHLEAWKRPGPSEHRPVPPTQNRQFKKAVPAPFEIAPEFIQMIQAIVKGTVEMQEGLQLINGPKWTLKTLGYSRSIA